ncbi:MAG: peptidoglycan-binding domain-containing protein [Gammaproteobacteria bacterium]|nr:peptidoglycan-binding domain-containing protein [Gammaproteobacteria bacterium]
MKKFALSHLALGLMILTASGCSTTNESGNALAINDTENRKLKSELAAKEAALQEKDQQISSYKSRLAIANASPAAAHSSASASPLLPTQAVAGECYARVWVPAKYRTVTNVLVVKEESERVEITPGEYQWAEEQILVKEASGKLETIPAVFGIEEEIVVVQEAARIWKTGLKKASSPASSELLATAKTYGIDLDSAQPDECFHEHYHPAKYSTEAKQVKISEATITLAAAPAEYRHVEKQVLVKEATFKLKDIPAEYEWLEEKMVDKPAHTTWKKGTGPIQRIDETTGEIMCLVEIPATYKTIRKRILKSPAHTEVIEIPAQYKTVKVRELAVAAKEIKTEVPAKFSSVDVTKKLSGPEFVWHEVHNLEEPTHTRTGTKICLTQIPEITKTIKRKVVKIPATTRVIEIPAEYASMKVRKVIRKPEEKRIKIPAEYENVAVNELDKEGFMEWRTILCETNMTVDRISSVQTALQDAGYNPGPIDGDIGTLTMAAVNNFQRDNKLPVDKYLNIETLKALGITAK